MCRFLSKADCLWLNVEIDLSRTVTDPSDGVSSDPIMLSKVVLPEPLGPTSPVNSPLSKFRLRLLSAVNSAFPTGNRLIRLSILIIEEFSIDLYINDSIPALSEHLFLQKGSHCHPGQV